MIWRDATHHARFDGYQQGPRKSVARRLVLETPGLQLQTLQAGHGVALPVRRGQSVVLVNTHGNQVVDTWAFNADDVAEFMSMEQTRSRLSRVVPRVGDALVSNRRRAILTLEADESPGVHDTLLCACGPDLYRELGCDEGHRSCEGNLHEALGVLGLTAACTPAPLNLFMNVSVGRDNAVIRDVPRSGPGDSVTLRAEMDAVVVFSACPQDVTPINGAECMPRDVAYAVT